MKSTTPLVLDAMLFAREVHKDQRRKYTNNPYVDHLAEVAGIAATVYSKIIRDTWSVPAALEEYIATCWLHDCMEDQNVTYETLEARFGIVVAKAVLALSDLEEGNRATRKALTRERLAAAPGWVQTIKCADLISNTGSIMMHDPKFAVTYMEEARMLLQVLANADLHLRKLAWEVVSAS